MGTCHFYLESDQISMMAGGILDRFTAHRDRRLKNVFINRFGKRREERHSCSRDVLKFLRDAYISMRMAQAYAECLENGLLCEMNAGDLQQQLMEAKAELRKENLSLRRAEVEVDEEPAGAFDGRMTKCRLDEHCLRYTRMCEHYVRESYRNENVRQSSDA